MWISEISSLPEGLFNVLCICGSPLVQFQLLHSKFHLCSSTTRAILLSTYVKFVNLFPEIKPQIQNVSQGNRVVSLKYCDQKSSDIFMKLVSIFVWS